jgi:hypothetical protein
MTLSQIISLNVCQQMSEMGRVSRVSSVQTAVRTYEVLTGQIEQLIVNGLSYVDLFALVF